MDPTRIQVGRSTVGPGRPVFVIAELSANHHQSLSIATEMIHAAKQSGADAVKLQTYTPDTMTIDCDNEHFRLGKGTPWEGHTFYELYAEAYTPWEWFPSLYQVANRLGMELFSTPFDETAVEFLEDLGVPAYKVASFELVDIPLIAKVAATGKPIILSTGMATAEEISNAVNVARQEGATEIALLHCTSVYPAPPDAVDLRTIPDMAERFNVVAGLSDHTLGIAVSVAAVALGACIVEKHFTLNRNEPGPDSGFSLEPNEFKAMVEAIRIAESAVGDVRYGPHRSEHPSLAFRRSLFVVEDIKIGEALTTKNIRSIRPGYGLPPAELGNVIGRKAKRALHRGTPVAWEDLEID